MLEDPGRDRKRALRRQEVKVAVAALEAALLAELDAGGREAAMALRRVVVAQPVDEAARMGAAADALAVGVEDGQLELGQVVLGQHPRHAETDLLDQCRGCRLAHVPAGVREAGLDADPAAAADIVAVGRNGQGTLNDLGAALEGGAGLEQRRDIDPVLDPEQLGEVQRRQQRERGLALGDQEADRLAAVQMLEHLGHGHEHPARRRPLLGDRAEVDGLGLGRLDQPRDGVDVGQAVGRVVRRMVHADGLADRIVQLDRVDPHVRAGGGQALGRQFSPQHAEIQGHAVVDGIDQGTVDQSQRLARIGQTGTTPGHHVLGHPGQSLAPVRILVARRFQDRDVVLGGLDGQRQPRLQQLQQRRQRRLAPRPLEAGQHPRPVMAQLIELDQQPLGEGHRPRDVGPAVGVVADPGGQSQQARPQAAPLGRIELLGDAEGALIDSPDDRAGLADHQQGLRVLLGQVELERWPVRYLLRTVEQLAAARRCSIAGLWPKGRSGEHDLQLHGAPERRV